MTRSELEQAIDPWLQHMTWRRDYATWRERRINQEHYQAERLAQLARLAGPVGHLRLLDLGAGMGGFAVAAALAGAQVTASEYNPDYCSIIRLRAARYQLTIPVHQGPGEQLPYMSGQFDVVVCWDVIEHVQSPTRVLGEIARVLRPGGSALLTVINRLAWIDPHYHIPGLNWLPRPLAERLIERRGRSKQSAAFKDMQRLSEMHYYTFSEFTRLAASHGFRVRDMREELLQAGQLHSPKPTRRAIRGALRAVGLERLAYRLQRDFYTGMFELGLVKQP